MPFLGAWGNFASACAERKSASEGEIDDQRGQLPEKSAPSLVCAWLDFEGECEEGTALGQDLFAAIEERRAAADLSRPGDLVRKVVQLRLCEAGEAWVERVSDKERRRIVPIELSRQTCAASEDRFDDIRCQQRETQDRRMYLFEMFSASPISVTDVRTPSSSICCRRHARASALTSVASGGGLEVGTILVRFSRSVISARAPLFASRYSSASAPNKVNRGTAIPPIL
jgi:hypothetical protein